MITRITDHDSHEVYVQMEYYTLINHYASLRCKDCNKHIQWLHKSDVEEIKKLGVKISSHRMKSPNTPKQQRRIWL
jgi:hypothetical protein